jgi:hypothetical protein
MDITTKFNIGERIFVMHNNRIVETNIGSIYIIALPQTTPCSNIIVKYKVYKFEYDLSEEFEVNENEVFRNKEDLIQYLVNYIQ